MSSFELNANSFLRALTIYTDNPSSDTKFQLQRRASDFVRAVIEHENTIEQRVIIGSTGSDLIQCIDCLLYTSDAADE